jgi:hypothetical protein
MFLFTFVFIGGMLLSGSRSNKKLKRAEYYEEIINEYENKDREEKLR